MRTELFICECHYVAHQMIISYDDNDDDGWDEVNVEIHLSNYLGFWKRLYHGIRYIFGYRSSYGDFDGLTINPDDADKLQTVVDYLRIAKINKDGNRVLPKVNPNKIAKLHEGTD